MDLCRMGKKQQRWARITSSSGYARLGRSAQREERDTCKQSGEAHAWNRTRLLAMHALGRAPPRPAGDTEIPPKRLCPPG
jgi:hypothetical protein